MINQTNSGSDTPEYQGDAPEQKVSQADANYRRGSLTAHCGICKYYEGGDQCSQVESPISGYGISDIYRSQRNPFGQTLGPQERAIANSLTQSPPDQSPQVQTVAAPSIRIGGKTY